MFVCFIFFFPFNEISCQYHRGRNVLGQKRRGDTFEAKIYLVDIMAGGQKFFAAFVRDLSERKKTESELLEKCDEMKSLLASCSDMALFLLDTDTSILTSNSVGNVSLCLMCLSHVFSFIFSHVEEELLDFFLIDAFILQCSVCPFLSLTIQCTTGLTTVLGYSHHELVVDEPRERLCEILGWSELPSLLTEIWKLHELSTSILPSSYSDSTLKNSENLSSLSSTTLQSLAKISPRFSSSVSHIRHSSSLLSQLNKIRQSYRTERVVLTKSHRE